jgi:hypothetical protein
MNLNLTHSVGSSSLTDGINQLTSLITLKVPKHSVHTVLLGKDDHAPAVAVYVHEFVLGSVDEAVDPAASLRWARAWQPDCPDPSADPEAWFVATCNVDNQALHACGASMRDFARAVTGATPAIIPFASFGPGWFTLCVPRASRMYETLCTITRNSFKFTSVGLIPDRVVRAVAFETTNIGVYVWGGRGVTDVRCLPASGGRTFEITGPSLEDMMVRYANVLSESVHEVYASLGVDAARIVLEQQFRKIANKHDLSVTLRHIHLLSSFMTATGKLRAFNVTGIQDGVQASVLRRATFSKVVCFVLLFPLLSLFFFSVLLLLGC